MNATLTKIIFFVIVLSIVSTYSKAELGIVNGHDVKVNQLPYQAYLKFEDSEEQWFCGGTLISRNYVLTAGYCTLERDGTNQKATVYLGANNVSLSQEDGRLEITSTEIITHESLKNKQRASGNIGLVKLPEPVTYTDTIQPISLGTREQNISLVNVTGRISGWGSTDMFYDEPEVLQQAHIIIVDNDKCKGVSFFDKSSQLCGGNIKKLSAGICDRDIGGPLVVNGTQVGIIFISDPVCNINVPQMFIKVSYYYDWLEQHSDVVIN